MTFAYIALGSNLQNPALQLKRALYLLATFVEVVTVSSFFVSPPLGDYDQPYFVNAVACIKTQLLPLELLDVLQDMELRLGRTPSYRWGPRLIDLDLLLYDDLILQTERLTLPHPGMYERAFVLQPLFEIAPQLQLPTGERLADLVVSLEGSELELIAEE